MFASKRTLSHHVEQTCNQSAPWEEGKTIVEIKILFLPPTPENCLNVSLSLQVNWHDFAFFDPVMYESLRQLIRHSQAGEADAVFAAMDLAFAIDLCKEEGAGQVMEST